MPKELPPILCPSRYRNNRYAEPSLMALLLLLGVIQIAGAFGAGLRLIQDDHASLAAARLHDAPLLAHK